MSVGQVLPLLSDLQDAHDLPTSTLGIVAATSFFASMLGQLLLAPVADRGHTRALLAGSMAVAALGNALFALANGLALLVVARAVIGLGLGAYLPAARALVADHDRDRAGELLGRLTSIEVAGFIIGPLFGVLLVDWFGLDGPFVFSALTTLAAVPVLLFLPLPTLSRGDESDSVTTAWRLLRRREVLVAVLFSVALQAPVGMYEAVWDIYLDDLDLGNYAVATTLALYGITFVAVAPIGGRIADRMGAIPAATATVLVIIPVTALYGQVASLFTILVLLIVEASANGAGIPAAQAAMARATEPGELATGQGLAGAAGVATAGVVALAAAPIYARYGAQTLFAATAATVAVFGMAALGLARTVSPVNPNADTNPLGADR